MSKERSFALRDEYITLGQLLKAADVVSSGGEVKALLASETLIVNGETEARRGRKLRPNDIVKLPSGETIRIAAGPGSS